ncbi:MAG: tannase/feruloyl esterase family alpha/beta hydrolase [Gammaproteobacteria bacterium]|nr:tannase/feruloyl esterase family alpha/beta hydrolase [Gammaproteobacteria bacterium]
MTSMHQSTTSATGRRLWTFTLIAAALGCAAISAQAVESASEACANLAGKDIPAPLIGLPTTGASITSATLVAASAEGNANGEYCKVLGAIHPVDYTAPDINIEVNLPSNWNGKSLQFGGGGLNGVLITGLGRYAKQPENEATPLARGYVTLGSDSGHQSTTGFDGSFYLNREALENYGHQQLKKTHDVAMRLVELRYGKKPQYNYFIGGSQGGHEGFDVAQRYPDDYHGVVAGYPAHNVVMLHLSALQYARALHANDGRSWLNPAEVKYLVDNVYQRCDDLDGAKDGIISNVAACITATAEFKALAPTNPLRCANGADAGDSCLSDAQLQALNVMDTPYDVGFKVFNDDAPNGVFPKWTPFEGSTFTDGGSPKLGETGPGQALQVAPGVATSGLAIAQDLTMDAMKDFDARRYPARIVELAQKMSANSTRLDRFRAHGGKLIFFHGTIDDYIPVYSSIQYFQRLQQRYPQDALDEFVRFYTVPGMGHVTGVFNARMSTLDALEAWVEHATAPTELVASDANEATRGRTRPVCRYPQWPQYTGRGDINKAASFNCVAK